MGFDADDVHDLGLSGAEDRDVLARAAEDDGVMVTENAADVIPLRDAGLAVAFRRFSPWRILRRASTSS